MSEFKAPASFNLNAMILNSVLGPDSKALTRFVQLMLLPLPIEISQLARQCRLPADRMSRVGLNWFRCGLVAIEKTKTNYDVTTYYRGRASLRGALHRSIMTLREPERSQLAKRLGLISDGDPKYKIWGFDADEVSIFVRNNASRLPRFKEVSRFHGNHKGDLRVNLVLKELFNGDAGKARLADVAGGLIQPILDSLLELEIVERVGTEFTLKTSMRPIVMFLPRCMNRKPKLDGLFPKTAVPRNKKSATYRGFETRKAERVPAVWRKARAELEKELKDHGVG